MAGEWKRGHAARGRDGFRAGPAPLEPPAATAPDDLEDLDDMTPEEYAAAVASHGPPDPDTFGGWPAGAADGSRDYIPADIPGPAPGPLPKDPPAGRVPRRGGKPRGRAGQAGRAAPKITQAVRNDIEGKLGLMLQLGGSAWAARDPVCGGAFLGQLPAIRPATVDLILLSPDLVAWFVGVGGGFMLWFNLLAAFWPVLATVWAHHGPGAADDDGQDAGAAQAQQAYAA